MKEMKDINIKELKIVVKELNDSGMIDHKIKMVGISNANLVEAFTKAVETIDEDAEIPDGIAAFYNDLYADETADGEDDTDTDEDESEDADDPDTDEDEDEIETSDEDEIDKEDEEETSDEEDEEAESDVEEVEVKPKKTKSPKKELVIKKDPPKKKLHVEKRATVNTKLSLTNKVKNILNFADQRYKKTAYFPLDCETIRILETNVGLYPTEILAAMQQDKKVAKKIEKFKATAVIREINKIKTAYSYIVGAISEDKADGKFRNIMTTLLAGKDVPPEVAHYSTVKVARRGLLAYLDVTGVDYSVMQDVRKDLVKKASEKKKQQPESVAPTPEPPKKTPPKKSQKK